MALVRRIAPLVIGAVFLGWVLFPDIGNLLFGTHPVEDGTVLVFQIEETTNKLEERYGLRMRFREEADGGFHLDIISPHGARSLKLTDELEPIADPNQDRLEIPIIEKGIHFQPGALWLPYERREAGRNCLAGVVMGIYGYEQWKTWQVMHPDGIVHYEQESGLLVGFEFVIGFTTLKGRLRSLR